VDEIWFKFRQNLNKKIAPNLITLTAPPQIQWTKERFHFQSEIEISRRPLKSTRLADGEATSNGNLILEKPFYLHQGCQIFLGQNIPKRENDTNNNNYTKRPCIIPNGYAK
jgi:hypothetical protein